MPIIILIVSILIILVLFWATKTDDGNIYTKNNIQKNNSPLHLSIENIEDHEIYTEPDGKEYILVEKTREIPQRTYIYGLLKGKYWAIKNDEISNQFAYSDYYDFNLYEATINNSEYALCPFPFTIDTKFPFNILPHHLDAILYKDGEMYKIKLHEPLYSNVKIDRKLHQSEGKEAFGTLEAIVTGYILNTTHETYLEKIFLDSNRKVPNVDPTKYNNNIKNTPTTIKVKEKSPTKYINYNEGCFSTTLRVLGGIIGIAFLLLLLPYFLYILPIVLILIVLSIIPSKYFKPIFEIFGFLLFLVFIGSAIYSIIYDKNPKRTYIPKPIVNKDKPQERKIRHNPYAENEKRRNERNKYNDSVSNRNQNDTLITHYRIWNDYDGKQYEGIIWIKSIDYENSKKYKQNFNSISNPPNGYDDLLYNLKEKDKYYLDGVYYLFDSIQNNEHLSSIKFAELIVSFVQDIPYTIIVPDDCNPNLYDDKFIKEYLSTNNARCDGYEKFGINTPVEFMATLNGDCDTRTLLIYTLLSHYGYDVAIFSSEYYAHSIIGINISIPGIAYEYANKRYVLWETTAPNIRPGILPKEISNLKYWRISLKSK